MKAICVLLVFVAITSVAAEQAPPIELVLRTPQTAYAIGDPIPVSLLIRARDPSQLLEYRQDAVRNFYGNFTVIGPEGMKLRRLSDVDVRVSPNAEWMTVSNNGSLVRSADLTEIYSEPYYIAEPHSMTATGVYQVSYSAEIAVRPVGVPNDLWVGPITSATLNVQIISVDSGSLRLAYQAVSEKGKDRSLQLRALTKIQYSDAPLTTGDYDLLRRSLRNSDQEIKTKVIRVFGAKVSAEGFKAISGVLATENDPLLRSEAIAALGRYNTPAARKLILDECKARKERSYRAAVVVLGAVGDESCIDVLQEIAKTDETEWVRERALESIKQIEERIGR